MKSLAERQPFTHFARSVDFIIIQMELKSFEMKERLNKIVPDNNAFVGTFHALGVRIIRENAGLLGLDKNFAIIDSDDVLSIIKKIMKNNGMV